MAETQKQLGPARISFPTLLVKTLAGLIGGGIGSLIFFVIFMFVGTLINPLIDPSATTGDISPVFVFVVSVMVFLASTVGNMLSVLFLSLTEREKYTKTSTAIYHVFIISVVMFLLMVPVYFIAYSFQAGMTMFAVLLHIILAAFASALIMEAVSNNKYTLVGIYSLTFSIVLSAAVLLISQKVALFLALPVVWGCMSFVYSVFSMIYGWIVDIYDKDFLSLETSYGKDYGKAVESDRQPAPKAKDEAGAEFLRHN